MKIIAVNLPESLLGQIEELILEGIYPNRSEAIRTFVRSGIKNEISFIEFWKTRSKYYEFYKDFIKNILGLQTYGTGRDKNKKKYKLLMFKFKAITKSLSIKGLIKKSNNVSGYSTTYEIVNEVFLE